MGTTVLETKGTYMKGLTRYTYWIMPLYPLLLAGWFHVLPFGLFTLRLSSVLFGCAVIVAWFWIIRKLVRDDAAAVLTAALLSCDFVLIRSGAVGRMDMMCAALGFGGIAVYLAFRETAWNRAVLAGHALTACSLFTHPNGIMHAGALLFLMLYLDRERVRIPQLALGALPYLLIGGAWGLYIAQAPDLFRSQFGGNARGRGADFLHPLVAITREVREKYLGAGSAAAMLAKASLLPFYAVGVIGCLAVRDLRANRGIRALIGMTAIYFFYNVLFDAVRIYLYLVHVVPCYIALFAVFCRWLWMQKGTPRWLTAAATAAFLAAQLAGTGYTIVRRAYTRDFVPVATYLKQHARPGELVVGSAELAFALGFDGAVLDDARLGYDSGNLPDFIVVDPRYKERLDNMPPNDPAKPYTADLLARKYTPVYATGGYQIYQKRAVD